MKLTDENSNKSCFTTRYVLYDNSPIVYVIYDDDGDWRFLGEEHTDESDVVVVSVGQMLDHDQSLRELPDLEEGQIAARDKHVAIRDKKASTGSSEKVEKIGLWRGIARSEPELTDVQAVRASEGGIPESDSFENAASSDDPDASLPYWLFEAGSPLSDSIATRSCRIEVDTERLCHCDLHAANARRSRNIYLALSLLLLGGAVSMFATGHWVWGAGGLLMAAFMGLLSRAHQLVLNINPYASGLLVPGTVVDPGKREIIVLANVDLSDLDGDPQQQRPAQWACRRICVKNLSPHQLKVGERVPCVALFGNPNETVHRYKFFNPYPLAWATADLEAINRDAERISQGEWNLLYCLSSVMYNHQPEIRENQLALFDKNRKLITVE